MTSVELHRFGPGVGDKVDICFSLTLQPRPQEPRLQPALQGSSVRPARAPPTTRINTRAILQGKEAAILGDCWAHYYKQMAARALLRGQRRLTLFQIKIYNANPHPQPLRRSSALIGMICQRARCVRMSAAQRRPFNQGWLTFIQAD